MANGNSNSTPGGSRRTWITAAVVLVALFLAVGAYVRLRPHRIRISVVKPSVEDLSSAILTNGKVEPIQSFEAHAPLPVTVQRVLVKEGDRVKAGQLLLELDDTRARSDLAVAQTRLKGAEATLSMMLAGGSQQQLLSRQADLEKTSTERDAAQRQLSALERLSQRGAASGDEVAAARDRLARAQADLTQLQSRSRFSPQEIERSRSEVADARATVALAEDVLRNSDVRAPFDGTVYFLPAKTGAYVAMGDLLLQEANLSKLQVRAFVDEPEIGRLALGQSVRITWDALPGHSWQGTLTTLPATVISRGSRVVGEVLCTVEATDGLLPNVNVNATIIANSKSQALTVPREAVREDSGRNFVYVVSGNHLTRRDVKLGISNLTKVEILSGISAGDVVGVQSFSPSPMTEGAEVKIVENSAE